MLIKRVSDPPKTRISELKGIVGHYEARKLRARERLLHAAENHWYFAILGLELESAPLQIGTDDGTAARFTRVIEAPGEIELAAACKDSSIFGAVGRYSRRIHFELEVSFAEAQAALNLGWLIVSALRVRTCAEILIVAVADHSWSAIAGIDDGTCNIQLLEDHPRAHRFEGVRKVTAHDVAWIATNLMSFLTLLESANYRLAVDSLCLHHQLANKRTAATILWSGIEALFLINAELRFRLAACVAAALEERGQPRIDCYRRVKRLYDFRSRLVHGAEASEDAIVDHVIEVRQLLSRLICLYAEEGKLHNEARIEELLFG